MFKKLLIAERGEMVMRIARTCERAGIATVAIHGALEDKAPYVAACDEAVCIDEAAAVPLQTSTIIAAAKQSGADAVHPGCGSLRQSVGLALAAREAGLSLVGPAADALQRCAARTSQQELARLAGIRALPDGLLDPAADPLQQARDTGYPLWLESGVDAAEAVRVEDEDELSSALERARQVRRDGPLYLRRWLDRPRLLAVQLAADAHKVIALGDLEHSLELRGRVFLEESPTPAFTGPGGELRRVALRDAAVRITQEAAFCGLATAEFLLDAEGQLYFLELRPGLAIEHALVEFCTGLDLVELQLSLAAGEPLPPVARRAQATGHAVEARIHADDPLTGMVGQPVEIAALRWPVVAPGSLRIETDLTVGSRPALDRDRMVAKIIAYGRTRHQAVLTLDRVLAEAVLDPLATNLECLREILVDESFRAGHYDNEFVERLLVEIKTRK